MGFLKKVLRREIGFDAWVRMRLTPEPLKKGKGRNVAEQSTIYKFLMSVRPSARTGIQMPPGYAAGGVGGGGGVWEDPPGRASAQPPRSGG